MTPDKQKSLEFQLSACRDNQRRAAIIQEDIDRLKTSLPITASVGGITLLLLAEYNLRREVRLAITRVLDDALKGLDAEYAAL